MSGEPSPDPPPLYHLNTEDPSEINQTEEINTAECSNGDTSVFLAYEEQPSGVKRSSITDTNPRPTKASKKVNNEQWDAVFARLVQYKEQHGDCLVPKRYSHDPKLGTWVETQRVQYKRLTRIEADNGVETDVIVVPNKRLNQERLDKLHEIGFCWSAKQQKKKTAPVTTAPKKSPPVSDDTLWNPLYERLCGYREAFGNCLVPRKYPPDQRLAAWVENQRKAALVLSEDRKAKLDQIGFVWSLRSKRIEDHWDEMFRQLLEYKEQHGDCLVPSRYEANLKLGKWIETQRYEYTKLKRASSDEDSAKRPSTDEDSAKRPAKPRLTKERIDRLEAIGFEWKVKNKMKRYYDKQWDQMFERLLQFKELHGHCMVPRRFPYDTKLATWVHTQRLQYRKLLSVGSKKNPASPSPDPTQQTAGPATNDKENVEVVGDTMVGTTEEVDASPSGMEDSSPLVISELNCHSRSTSDIESNEDTQPLSLDNAETACASESSLPEEVVGALNAGSTELVEGSYRLTDARLKRLEEIGFVWSVRDGYKPSEQPMTRNSYDDQWDAMFARLAEYKDRFGHCLVPKRYQDDPKLATWVDTQRVQYKKMKKKLAEQGIDYVGPDETPQSAASSTKTTGKPVFGRLTDDRIRRLESLGFAWSLRDDWQTHFRELQMYKSQHGHCNVPARYPANRRLGIWVSAMRQQYKLLQAPPETRSKRSAPLTQDRINLLNDLGFTWTIRARENSVDTWRLRIMDLQNFMSVHGHCHVPTPYPANPELGIWCEAVRTEYQIGTCPDERVRQLDAIGFVWESPEDKDLDIIMMMESGSILEI